MSCPLLSVVLCLALSGAEAAYSFITVGDWGGAALSTTHSGTAHKVAAQMGQTASSSGIHFVVNVGDNFYYCGIQNTSDFQIGVDYTSIYTSSSLQVPWYSALGNHEYGYNVDAQIKFAEVDPSKRWYLPSRYYTKRISLTADEHMTVIVLDTSPCIKEYRSESKYGWDPCGSDFPTCAPIDEGECKFHENILSQDCSTQFTWFKEQLEQVPKDDWLVVVGHHPADEINVEDFTSAMQSHGFNLYLAGHVHALEQSSIDGNSAFVISGGGSMVKTKDQENDERCVMSNQPNSTKKAPLKIGVFGHSTEQVWNQKVAGFTTHTFSDDFKSLKTDFISADGEVIHSFTVEKGGAPAPPSPPSPSPTPGPPPPSGACAGAGATWRSCTGACTYVHAGNVGKCGVNKYGCYDCSKLSAGCPDCKSEALVV